jgi:single-strand DNA-binding protein
LQKPCFHTTLFQGRVATRETNEAQAEWGFKKTIGFSPVSVRSVNIFYSLLKTNSMEMQIVARLTKEAKVNTTTSGKQVINFDVAVNEKYRVKATGELKSNTRYLECSMWYGITLAKYLTKGKQLLVTGDVDVRAYINKENKPIGKLTFRVTKIKFLDGKNEDTNAEPQAVPAQVPATGTENTDDLPF